MVRKLSNSVARWSWGLPLSTSVQWAPLFTRQCYEVKPDSLDVPSCYLLLVYVLRVYLYSIDAKTSFCQYIIFFRPILSHIFITDWLQPKLFSELARQHICKHHYFYNLWMRYIWCNIYATKAHFTIIGSAVRCGRQEIREW